MAYHRIDPGLARLFKLGLDADMPAKVEEWKGHLEQGRVTDEMRTVFFGMGYISSMRDPRIKTSARSMSPSGTDPVDLQEPAQPGRRTPPPPPNRD